MECPTATAKPHYLRVLALGRLCCLGNCELSELPLICHLQQPTGLGLRNHILSKIFWRIRPSTSLYRSPPFPSPPLPILIDTRATTARASVDCGDGRGRTSDDCQSQIRPSNSREERAEPPSQRPFDDQRTFSRIVQGRLTLKASQRKETKQHRSSAAPYIFPLRSLVL